MVSRLRQVIVVIERLLMRLSSLAGALPFSDTWSRVSPKFQVPVNAVLLTFVISILLCIIDLGSSTAFSAILSLAAVGQMGTYSISITCLLWRRITAPQLLPKARWTLGRWGIPINAIGAAYAWFVFFFGFWPVSRAVTANTMNWAVAMFVGAVALSLGYYLSGAKKRYVLQNPFVTPVRTVADFHCRYAGPVTKTEAYRE